MAFNNSYTAVTGGTLSAAQWNTYVRDNFSAVFAYTTAGDMVYATSGSALARLAIGAAYKLLMSNSAGAIPEYNQAPFVIASHNDSTGFSYSTATWRDMPNSSNTITLLVTSTIIVFGVVVNYGNGATYAERNFKLNIDGTDIDTMVSAESYQLGEIVSTSIVGVLSGVAAGSRTIKMKDRCNAGSYYNERKFWVAVAIPERS